MSALLEQDKNSRIVEVVSAEGHSHNIAVNVAKYSGLLRRMIDDDDDNNNEAQIISLPPLNNDISSAILSKVIDFLQHYEIEPMAEIEKVIFIFHTTNQPFNFFFQPLRFANIGDGVQEWYANFVGNGLDQEVLFELILAANYMDIKPLLDLTCATVASMVKGKTPEEIRTTFNIVNDLTPQDEAAIREENKWWQDDA